MEPFGLLNLLSTLLPQTQEKQSPAPAPTEAPAPTTKNERVETADKENPCAAFLEAHDKRVRQTKR